MAEKKKKVPQLDDRAKPIVAPFVAPIPEDKVVVDTGQLAVARDLLRRCMDVAKLGTGLTKDIERFLK